MGVFGRISGSVANRVIDVVDPDVVLDHVDVNALLDRVDVDRLLERVDVDSLLDRVDVDRLLARADLEGLVRRAGVPEIVAESTGRFAGTAIDSARRQLLVVDVVVTRKIDRALRRTKVSWADGPLRLRPSAPRTDRGGRLDVSGRYAGPVTRLAALAIDIGIVFVLATLVLAAVDLVGRTFGLGDVDLSSAGPAWAWGGGLVVAAFLYSFLGLEVVGRTPGKAAVGLRVVRADGVRVGVTAAVVRTVVLPVSVAVAGLGLLLAVVRADRRALHDMVAGTAVVHDWAQRPATLPADLSRRLTGSPPPRSPTTCEARCHPPT